MNLNRHYLILFVASLLFGLNFQVHAEDLRINETKWESGDSILVVKGVGPKRTRITIKNEQLKTLGRVRSQKSGEWVFKKELSKSPCKVTAVANGQMDTTSVENSGCGGGDDGSTGGGPGGGETGGGNTGGGTLGDHVTLAINDLGMHCADLDYRIFSILPPYNVVHSQVIQKGTSSSSPRILGENEVDVYYKATPPPGYENNLSYSTSTSYNLAASADKGNFWTRYNELDANGNPLPLPNGENGVKVLGGEAYNPLYGGELDLNSMLPIDRGLPAPDVERLYIQNDGLHVHQQNMPGFSNTPQKFEGHVQDLPFFSALGFGYVANDLNRHTAEGIPILPVTNNNWLNPYPLMQVSAVPEGADANFDNATRVTLPVASEADCHTCHATQTLCEQAGGANEGLFCDGTATGSLNGHDVDKLDGVPGATKLQQLVNAAKINILRLHDQEHDTKLDSKRHIVCASCHYSPALDLAQLGPQGDQVGHASMSRVMHEFHSEFTPDMAPPVDSAGNPRNPETTKTVLNQTCYSCHPGKRSQCMRGAMTKAGIVCQDCHGNMAQVGDDFSLGDNDKRIPWFNEPGCQSCHTGDAVKNILTENPNDENLISAEDKIRLLQAYRSGDENASPLKAVNMRFAETNDGINDHLYRLSKGHGGVMCEGCHGSTHAEWPNPTNISNDNLTAIDLQGHAGVLIECDTCHAPGSLGLTLDGPHGMHPVNDLNWTKNHKEIAEHNGGQCKTCHGLNGEGTVLSVAAADRDGICKDEKGSLCSNEGQQPTISKGTKVSCTLCHGNYINE